MKRTADIYFQTNKLSDIQIVSSLGFTEDDVTALRNQDNIKDLQAGYTGNYLSSYRYHGVGSSGAEVQDLVVQIQSLPENISTSNQDYLNQISIIKDGNGVLGRMPEKDNEVIVLKSYTMYNVGDTFTVYDTNNPTSLGLIKEKEYTVVAVANTPLFITSQYGNSNVGSGIISAVAYAPVSNFQSDFYTNVYASFKNTQGLGSFSQEYKNLAAKDIEELETFSEERAEIRYDGIVSDAQEKIDEAKNNIENAKTQLNDAQDQLNNAQTTIDQSVQELASGKLQYNDGKALYDQAVVEINQAKDNLNELYQNANTLDDANQQLQASKDQVNALFAQGGTMQAMLIQNEIYKQEAEIVSTVSSSILQQANALEAAGDAENAAVFRSLSHQIDTKGTVVDAANILRNQANVIAQQINSGEQELNVKSEDLSKVSAQIAEAEQKIKSGQAELAAQQQNFNEQKVTADAQISEGEEQTKQSEEQLAQFQKPTWYVWDRNYNVGYLDFQDNSDRVGNIAKVFPVFFFLVALLVCLTTMTRMIEDERTQIGTLKVLGYSNGSIALKYLTYAITASLSGGIIGSLMGYAIFPPSILGAYSMLYFLPTASYHYWPSYAIVSITAGVLCTLGATMWACYSTLMSIPTELLHPKVPPPGKPIFLEKIPALWNRIKFSHKVTIRNLFRYKQRFIMTVLGVAGCTACLLTGFGLRDAIFDIEGYQYNQLSFYNVLISLENPSTPSADTPLNDLLNKDGEFAYVRLTSVNANKGDKSLKNGVNLAILEDVDQFKALTRFQDRKTQKEVVFDDTDGVIVSEKFASIFNLKKGSTFNISSGDSESVELTVSGITENYVSNYIYMKPDSYQHIYNETPKFWTVLLKLNSGITEQTTNDTEARKEMLGNILSLNNVTSVIDTDQTRREVVKQLAAFDVLVTIIIITACTLAVVVLYNLTNINIIERKREIASLKVLGFSEREVAWYIYRENLALVIIGILVGLIMGIFLERYVVITTEVSSVMFRRIIKPLSFGLSIMFTLFSNVVVSIIMKPKIKAVKMVESLKSSD